MINPTYDEWFREQLTEFGKWNWCKNHVNIIVEAPNEEPRVMFEQLIDFFGKMKVGQLKEGNMQKLFDAGYTSPESIINLPLNIIQDTIGSKVVGTKIFKEISSSLTNVPIYQIMGAHASLGRGIGIRRMKELWTQFKGDMSKCGDINNILAIKGFKDKTASLIVNGVDDFNAFFDKIKDQVIIQDYSNDTISDKYLGKGFVFTGFRDKALEEMIFSCSGKVQSSVSKNTFMVIVKSKSDNSGKIQKAQKMGIQIEDRESFLKFHEA